MHVYPGYQLNQINNLSIDNCCLTLVLQSSVKRLTVWVKERGTCMRVSNEQNQRQHLQWYDNKVSLSIKTSYSNALSLTSTYLCIVVSKATRHNY